MPTTTVTIIEIADLMEKLATINIGYLGISVTILVLLGGAFYLFNVKPLKDSLGRQEKTLTDLGKEVNENLSSSKKEIKNDLEVFKDIQDENISDLAKQRDGKLLSDIQTKIVSFEKEFTQKFDSFAEEKDANLKTVILAEVGNKVRELEKTLSSTINNLKSETGKEIASVKELLSTLQNNLKEVNRRTRELEVFKYSQQGKMGAIYGSIELLKGAIDEGGWRIEGYLEDLNRELKDINLEGELITRIEEQLVRLVDKPKYSPLVVKIRKHYQEPN
ncbi:hypothetical protein HQ544_03395 [Candidatus Falkowbacteria bacterium]|nr:hypothetical protein [Candidatus Falkowbacteria bacterium]